ncbi:DUF2971 domain-containing protein [Bradyrhizobium japonicum]|uniref:DUF2971 domain-containing protein n=1 Tax=Bradyrhizobium japonicum TaxID=375 RepID=UPI0005767B00|nr:DUF2971 domain-containing protein [Bradyrhizobium japonicum]
MQLVINPVSLRDDIVAREIASGTPVNEAEETASRRLESVAFDLVDMIKKTRNEVGVLSLSERSDGLLMWAHYAQDHRGVAIGLQLEQCLLPSNQDPNSLVWLDDVKYLSEKIDFIREGTAPWKSLLRKSEEWRYEEEWRIIRSLNTLRPVTSEVYVAELWPEAIKSVILGARMSPAEETAIIALLEASDDFSHIEIFKSVVSSKKLALEIIPFKEWASRAIYSEFHFDENWREIREWVDLEALGELLTSSSKAD